MALVTNMACWCEILPVTSGRRAVRAMRESFVTSMIWLNADALIAAMTVPMLASATVLHGIASPTGHATSALPRRRVSARRLPAMMDAWLRGVPGPGGIFCKEKIWCIVWEYCWRCAGRGEGPWRERGPG